MAVMLDMDRMDLEALRTRVSTLSADGHRIHMSLPLFQNADRAHILTTAFAQPRNVCVVVLSADQGPSDTAPLPDPNQVLAELKGMGEEDLGGGLDLILIAGPPSLADLPNAFHPLTLDDFDAPAAMLAILGGTPGAGGGHAGPTLDTRDASLYTNAGQTPGETPTRQAWRQETDERRSHRGPTLGWALLPVAAVLVLVMAGVAFWLFADTQDGAPLAQNRSKPSEGLEPERLTSRSAPQDTAPNLQDADQLYARQALRLHDAPRADSPRVAFAAAGDPLTRLGTVDGAGWTQVRLEDGTAGFAFTPLLMDRPVRTGPNANLVRVQDGPDTPPLVMIGALSGRIGSRPGDPGHQPSEEPTRLIRLATPRLAGEREVSRREWSACVEAGACPALPPSPVMDDTADLAELPATGMSWQAAQGYTVWLSRHTGRRYRLPSEAEWELAARAGSRTAFAFGDQISTVQANFAAGDASDLSFSGRSAGRALRVGKHPGNSLGLRDMHGNAAEWTADCWSQTHESRPEDGQPLKNSESEASADCSRRTIRGGSWQNDAAGIRSASRFGQRATEGSIAIGLRVFREL